MEQGRTEQAIIRQALLSRQPIPKAILDRPELNAITRFYFDAFQELNSCRHVELGLIPWTALIAYCNEYSITGSSERHEFIQVIRQVDAFYVNAVYDKQERKRKINNESGKLGGKR